MALQVALALLLLLALAVQPSECGVTLTPHFHCTASLQGFPGGCPAGQSIPLIQSYRGATGNFQRGNCGNVGRQCGQTACLCRAGPGDTLFDFNQDGFVTNESLPCCLPQRPGDPTRIDCRGTVDNRFAIYGRLGLVDYPDRVLQPAGALSAPCPVPQWDFALYACSMVTAGTFVDQAVGSATTNKLYCGYQRNFLQTSQVYRGEVWYDCSNPAGCFMMDRSYFTNTAQFQAQRRSFSGGNGASLPTSYFGFIQPPRRTCTTLETGTEVVTGVGVSRNTVVNIPRLVNLAPVTGGGLLPTISFVRKKLLVFSSEGQCRLTLDQLHCGVAQGWGQVMFGSNAARMTGWSPIRRGRPGIDYINSPFCRPQMQASVAATAFPHGQTPRVDSNIGIQTCIGDPLAQFATLKFSVCNITAFEPGDGCGEDGNRQPTTLFGIPQGDSVGFEECLCASTRIGNNCQFDRTALCGPIDAGGGGRCFGGPGRGGSCPFSDDPDELNSCFYSLEPFCQSLAAPVPPATSLCTCNPGFYGTHCSLTCTTTSPSSGLPLFGHAACPANSFCIQISTAQGSATICQCDVARGFFPLSTTSGGSALQCVSCVPGDCSGNGICLPPTLPGSRPTCQCRPGFEGSGCEVLDHLDVPCGSPSINISCDLEFPLPGLLSDATYTCSFSGVRTLPRVVFPASSPAQQYPLVFACTGIGLFTPTAAAGRCSAIKRACRMQLVTASNAALSNDMCPLPFIDLEPPYRQQQPNTDFCNAPADTTAFPVPFPIQWLRASFGRLTFGGFLLSTALPGLRNANVYRFVNNPADASTITIRCDVNLTRSETLVFHNQPLALARRVLQTC